MSSLRKEMSDFIQITSSNISNSRKRLKSPGPLLHFLYNPNLDLKTYHYLLFFINFSKNLENNKFLFPFPLSIKCPNHPSLITPSTSFSLQSILLLATLTGPTISAFSIVSKTISNLISFLLLQLLKCLL